MKRNVGVTVFALLFLFNLKGQEADTVLNISLKQAVEYGLENAIQIRQADLDVEDRKHQVKEVTGIGLPQINAGLSYNDFLQVQTSLIPAEGFGGPPGELAEVAFGVQYQTKFDVGLSQIIFSGSYITGLQAAKALLSLTEYQRSEADFDVEKAIKDAYYAVLVGRKNIELLNQNLTTTKQLFEDTKATKAAGLASATDADQIELNLNRIENLIRSSEIQLQLSKNLLKYEMGIEFEKDIILTDSLNSLVSEDFLNNSIKVNFNVQENNLYKLSAQNVVLQGTNVKYEKAQYMPSLAGFFNHSYSNFREDFTEVWTEKWFPQTVWGLQLDIPVFAGNSRYQKVQRAKVGVLKAEVDRENTERTLKLQLNQAETKFYVARNAYYTAQKALELADKIFNKTQIRFNEGLASSFDFNVAQTQQINSQQDLMNTIFELLQAKAELEKIYNEQI